METACLPPTQAFRGASHWMSMVVDLNGQVHERTELEWPSVPLEEPQNGVVGGGCFIDPYPITSSGGLLVRRGGRDLAIVESVSIH